MHIHFARIFCAAGFRKVAAEENKRGTSKNTQCPARLWMKIVNESSSRKKYAKVCLGFINSYYPVYM